MIVKNRNYLVSVIIPVYNGEKWLANAINSALNQTYTNLEIIVVDDGSTDSSYEEAQSFLYDSRVRLLKKSNGGMASARNFGLSEAKGDYIQFLDCDDTLQPNLVEACLGVLNDKTDFVLFGFNILNAGRLLRTPHPDRISYSDNNYLYFKKFVWLLDSACNKFYKRSYIQHKFLSKAVYGEDGIFNFENYHRNVCIECIPDCLYNVNLDNPNSINKRYKKGRLDNSVISCERKVQLVDNCFGEQICDVDFIPKSLSFLAFSVRLAAVNLTLSDFKEEILHITNFYSFLRTSINRAGGLSTQKPHNKLILYFLSRRNLCFTYYLSRLINRFA